MCQVGRPGGSEVKNPSAKRELRFDPWVRKWQPTPLFLPGKFQGQRSQVEIVHGIARVRHDWDTQQEQCVSHCARLQVVETRALLSKEPTGKRGLWATNRCNSNKAGNVQGALGSRKRHGAKAAGSWRALPWEVHLSWDLGENRN